LNILEFDFNYPSPLPFLERFARVGELQADQAITTQAEELLRVATKHIVFLNYRPSLIAAAALVLAYSLQNYERDLASKRNSAKATKCDSISSLIRCGVIFWDENMYKLTGIKS